MVDDLKTGAEIARRRLHHRLWQLRDAQAWADGIILRMDRPHDWLIDVSTAQTTADARDALLHAEGQADEHAIWTALMGDWLQLLDAQPERDSEIAKVLDDLATSDDVPAREALGPTWSFWDDIDLAKEGSYGVVEEERRKLREFLVRWSRIEPTTAGRESMRRRP